MNITTTTKSNEQHHTKNRTITILLTIVLLSSLLIVGIVLITNPNKPSPDGMVHVKNEKELTDTINKAKKPTTIQLDNGITLTKPIIIPNKKNITLTSNTTTTEGFFKLLGAKEQTTITINHGGILHLAGITVTHMDTYGLGVNVTEGGKLFMTNGEISGNNGGEGDCLSYGNGVAVHEGGFFEMTGGVITGNRGSRFGGGVWVGGFFNMSGNAMIANNYNWTSCTGCGVYNEGSFIMSGNSVIANNTAEFGGGVFNEGSFIMSGNSMIANNTAFCGGGVYNEWQGSFVMTDNSMIANNTVSRGDVSEEDMSRGRDSRGGGVSTWGSFEMTDNAIISGNVADHYGGGVCIMPGVPLEGTSSSFVLLGNAMIVNNTADEGGGVCIKSGGYFRMTNGVIANNTAYTGGGVYVGEEIASYVNRVFEMSGGEISGNYAAEDYGGVYNMGTFNQTGGTITQNKTNGKHPNQ